MAVKVPPMLHKMSVAAQKAWYKKNKMEYPGAAGKEGRSAAQAKKDVGEINKKKAREAAIAAAAKASKKNKALVSSSERVREMGRRRRESGEGLGGGLETNRDILSYVRAGGTIKAGRLGEEVAKKEEPPFTPDKKVVRRGPGGPMSQAKWLAKQAMMKKIKSMKDVKEETKKYTDMSPEEKWKDARAEKDPVKKNAKLGALAMGGGGNITPKKPSLIPNSPRRSAADPKKYTQKDGQWVREEVEYIEEKLTAADPASKWISDFVASDNPKFEGKGKKERIKMALGAYYSATGKGKQAEELELIEAKKMEKDDEYENDDMDDEEDDEMEDEEEDDKKKKKDMNERYMGFKKLVSTIKARGGARSPEAVAAEKKMSEAALDPVGREDKDIDNDGDSDKTDVYLSKRRKAISSAIRKKVAGKMGK